jgi:hypothetical protein
MLGDFASLERRRLARVWSSLLKVKTAASGTPGEETSEKGRLEGGREAAYGFQVPRLLSFRRRRGGKVRILGGHR